MSFPLAPPALADARAACLLTSDDTIFQRLRHSPGCAGLNTAEELLLGAQPADEVVVENASGAVGAFKASIHLVHFQKRMRVSRKVSVEFIARGMWPNPKHVPQFATAKKADSVCCARRSNMVTFVPNCRCSGQALCTTRSMDCHGRDGRGLANDTSRLAAADPAE